MAAPAVVVLLAASACGSVEDDTASTTSTPTSVVAPSTTAPTTSTSAAPPPAPPALEIAWQPVDVGAVAPPARSGAVLVASTDGDLWLHGGHVDDVPLGDLWRFDGEQWAEVTTDPGPTPRSEHAAVWDDERDRLVIALGQGGTTEVFDDVWAFDPATSAWSQLTAGGPAARYGSCTVLDDDGRMIISHGFSSIERFGDTWALDLATASWSDITPTEGPRPSNRCLHACGFDPDTDEIILFGGRNDDQPYLGDTWRLGADGWREIPGDGPSPRARSRGAFSGELLVLGGNGPDGLTGDAWIQRDESWLPAPSGAATQRIAPAVATVDGVVWVFGGLSDTVPLADLWRSS